MPKAKKNASQNWRYLWRNVTSDETWTSWAVDIIQWIRSVMIFVALFAPAAALQYSYIDDAIDSNLVCDCFDTVSLDSVNTEKFYVVVFCWPNQYWRIIM